MHALKQNTRPAEIYLRLSDLLRGMEPGARLPPYSELKVRFNVPQRPLDLAYERLEEEGAVERRQGDGTYVLDPWAGGSFVCLLSSGFLIGDMGAYARLFYLALERLVHTHHPKTSTLILMTTERNYDGAEREMQVRERLAMLYHQTRLLGVFSTYALRQAATQAVFRELNLAHVTMAPVESPVAVLAPTVNDVVETGLKHLVSEGWRDILVVGLSTEEDAVSETAARLFPEPADRPRIKCHTIPQDMTSWHNTEVAWIEFIRARLRTGTLPEAILFTDDAVCRMVLIGAHLDGVALAERCAIVTLSNKDLSIHATRELTRLEYDHDLIAAESLRMMQSIFRGAVEVRREPIPLILHVGRSSHRSDYCHGRLNSAQPERNPNP